MVVKQARLQSYVFDRLRVGWTRRWGGLSRAENMVRSMRDMARRTGRTDIALWLDQWLTYTEWYRKGLPDYAYSQEDLLGFPSYRWYWFGRRAIRVKTDRMPVFDQSGFCGVEDGPVRESVLVEWDKDGISRTEMLLFGQN